MTDPRSAAHAELLRLWAAAGSPSSRQIARDMGTMSHTAVNAYLHGNIRRPRTLAALVMHLGGDVERFNDLWHTEADATDVPARPTSRDLLEEIFACLQRIEQRLGP